MSDYYLCLTPDFGNKETGFFLDNNGRKLRYRFWHHATTPDAGLSNPPALRQRGNAAPDNIFFAIEETGNPASPDFTVKDIMVDCSANANDSGIATPFQGQVSGSGPTNKPLLSFHAAPAAARVTINNNSYAVIGPYTLTQDTSGPLSKYEVTIVATVQNSVGAGDFWQFSIDPEVDVDNQ